jgi:SAM-dependent methyltransferase
MNNISSYDFGYSWYVGYSHVIPLALAAGVGGLALFRGWRIVSIIAGVIALWCVFGLVVTHVVFGLNRPSVLPTERFLASESGRVLDAGAGSGRAAISVLLARPKATVTGLDIYSGYWGIDDNTPERFMANARAAGAADRADARTGDMREMPFEDGEFDAVVSSYAIDHLGREGTVKALSEVNRVLKPGGEFLLMIVNAADWLVRLASPHVLGHHPRQDPERWRGLLRDGGFVLDEDGTTPATYYFYARKKRVQGDRGSGDMSSTHGSAAELVR